jgi:hypothetical protein
MSTHPQLDEGLRRLFRRGRDIGRTLKEQLPRSSHEAPSNGTYPVLSAPLVTLFISGSNRRESEAAFEALAASRTAFRVEQSPDTTVSARFAGKDQRGLAAVRKLAGALPAAQDILMAPGEEMDAEMDRRRVPGLRECAEYELNEYLSKARTDLDRILGNAMTTSTD